MKFNFLWGLTLLIIVSSAIYLSSNPKLAAPVNQENLGGLGLNNIGPEDQIDFQGTPKLKNKYKQAQFKEYELPEKEIIKSVDRKDSKNLLIKLNEPSLSFQEKRSLLFSLFGSEQDLDDLITVYHSSDDQKLKLQILRYLVRIGGVKAEGFLRGEWFELKSNKQKSALIQALGEGSTNESFQFLKELYEDDKLNSKIKTNLAHSLLNYPGGDDYVFKSLENADDDLMYSILESMMEKNLIQNKEFLSGVITSDLVDIEVKQDMIQALEPNSDEAYDLLLGIIKSPGNEELKIEALDKLHELDEEEIDFTEDLKKTLSTESSFEVRKAIYEALHLQDNLDVNFLLEKVIQEGNDETYLAGMQTIIHHLKLSGEDLSIIPLGEKNRVHDLANESQNEVARRLSKHL